VSRVARAAATWVEPGPWHASQATSISDQVVEKASVAASYPRRRFVEWHSAHMKFQFCCGPVQWSASPARIVPRG
jgi:hypothetical protein